MARLFNKIAQMLIMSFLFVPTYGMEENEYTSLKDEKFYKIYSAKAQCVIEDEILKKNYDIQTYTFNCQSNEDKPLLMEFAKRRIQSKKDDQVYPDLTTEDVMFLQNEKNFLEAFTTFLKNWNRVEFYSGLANKAVELSRVPEEGYSNGKPSIDRLIRDKNQQHINKLDNKNNELYQPLDQYMKYISEIHTQVAFNDWQQKNK